MKHNFKWSQKEKVFSSYDWCLSILWRVESRGICQCDSAYLWKCRMRERKRVFKLLPPPGSIRLRQLLVTAGYRKLVLFAWMYSALRHFDLIIIVHHIIWPTLLSSLIKREEDPPSPMWRGSLLLFFTTVACGNRLHSQAETFLQSYGQ